MASTSSLLRSAESTQKKLRQQQDAEVAYEWQLSAKTYDDFQAYSGYLADQGKKTSDPGESLAYAKSINTARSGYVSNEVQRNSVDVLEGRSTNADKKAAMIQLYYTAVDNGNLDLAQSMRLQIDNLDLKLQSESASAQILAGKLATLQAKSVDDAIDTLKGYGQELNDLFKQKGVENFTKEMGAYAKELGLEPGDFFGMHLRIAQEINSVFDTELASDSDPGNQRKFQTAKNSFNSDASIVLPGINGRDMKVSYQDLVDQADAARTGQTLFRAVQTGEGTVFERNKETGFVWGRDENGSYRAIPVYQPKTDYTSSTYKTRVNSQGNVEYLDRSNDVVAIGGKDGNIKGVNGKSINDAAKRDYNDLLKQNGFNVISGSGADYIEIANPGNLPGVTSETVQLYVNPEGKLQIAGGDNKFYNLDFDQANGQYKGLVNDVPNPITLLGDNFSKDFINKLDRSQLPAGAIGVVDPGLASSQLLRVAEFKRADISNQAQIDELRRAQDEAAKLQITNASQQLLQPTISPQIPAPTQLQAPAVSPQSGSQVGGQRDLLNKKVTGVVQDKPQQSLVVQQPARQPSLTVK